MGVVITTNSSKNIQSSLYNNFKYSGTSQENYKFQLQSKIDNEWEFASDVYTISEESPFGSNIFQNVDVRINHEQLTNTGDKLGDDFKEFIFQDIDHARGMGYKYQFAGSYWVTVNTDLYRKITASTTVRRCNNILRWVDNYGNYFEEPCIIDYQIKRPVDTIGSINPVTPNGFIQIYAQLNTHTRKIKEGQRFLFGNPDNWICFRVFGNGVRNYLNQQTTDNLSASYVMFEVGANYVNLETDDIVNGIADKYTKSYTITSNITNISGSSSENYQINANVFLNGNPVSEPLLFTTSASPIATVSSSGLVNLNSSGSCVIVISMGNNSNVNLNIPVSVSGSYLPQYEIRISPISDYLLQGNSQTYDVYGYANGILQPDTFTFDLSQTTIPNNHFAFLAIDGNHFSLTNYELYLDAPIKIVSTSMSGSSLKDVYLKGSW